MQEERELIVQYGEKLSASGLCPGTSGNISIYNAEKNLMAISPSGMDYLLTQPEDIVITDLEANIAPTAAASSFQPMGVCTPSSISTSPKRAPLSTPIRRNFRTTFAVLNQPIVCRSLT